jgi:hypothetical protein
VVQSWARREHEVGVGVEGGCAPGRRGAAEPPGGAVLPGEPPALQLIEEALLDRQEFAALEVQTQLLYALVDQVGACYDTLLCSA